MSVRHKKRKKECTPDITALSVKQTPSPSGEQMRSALAESAKVFLLAQLLPLKLEISDKKGSVCLSSFIMSARVSSDDKHFCFEITRSAMTPGDLAKLLKTVYRYYESCLARH